MNNSLTTSVYPPLRQNAVNPFFLGFLFSSFRRFPQLVGNEPFQAASTGSPLSEGDKSPSLLFVTPGAGAAALVVVMEGGTTRGVTLVAGVGSLEAP